jgi:hypothetical protein
MRRTASGWIKIMMVVAGTFTSSYIKYEFFSHQCTKSQSLLCVCLETGLKSVELVFSLFTCHVVA